jgi:hypothetical protein
LEAQQNIISNSLLVAGVLAPTLGLSNTLDIHVILIVLLVGPAVCALLQLTFLKHHLWITLDYRYLDYELGKDMIGENIFRRRGIYIRKELYQSKFANFYSALFGFAEGFFPTLVGFLYVFLFLFMSIISFNKIGFGLATILMIFWFLLDLLGLVLLIVIGIFERRWTLQYGRKKDVELGYTNDLSSELD